MNRIPQDLADMAAADAALAAAASEQAASNEQLIAYAEELEALKREITALESTIKTLKERYDHLRKVLIPEMMEKLGMVTADGKGSFTLASGARIALRNDTYASYLKQDQDKVFAWLRSNGLGDIIKETVHASTLRSMATELLSEGKELPPEIRVYLERTVTITGVK